MPTARFRPSDRTLGWILGTLAAACGGGVGPVDGPVTTLIVRGIVQDQSGAAVPGAEVRAAWRPWSCGELRDCPPDTSTAEGEFEVWLSELGEFPAACVRVLAEPPPDRELQSASLQLDRLPLERRDGPDTLALWLTLDAP